MPTIDFKRPGGGFMNELKGLRLGVALCGSFCTLQKAVKLIEQLVQLQIDITPIMSYNAYTTSTRFGKAEEFIAIIEKITGKTIIHTLTDAEPLGPKNMLDALLIAPCTGNTLAKLSHAITDTPVLLAAKSLMRNGKPIIISIATNDGLGLNLTNIGHLMTNENIFFVPFGEDETVKKPYSLVSDLSLAPQTIELAMNKSQLRPIFISYNK